MNLICSRTTFCGPVSPCGYFSLHILNPLHTRLKLADRFRSCLQPCDRCTDLLQSVVDVLQIDCAGDYRTAIGYHTDKHNKHSRNRFDLHTKDTAISIFILIKNLSIHNLQPLFIYLIEFSFAALFSRLIHLKAFLLAACLSAT